MLHSQLRLCACSALFLLLLASAKGQAPPTGITGAGTASAADLMADLGSSFWYESAGLVDLRYEPLGSIDGFNLLTEQISRNPNLTFALRDYPVSDVDKDNLASGYGKTILHIPLALEGIAVAFSLPAGSIPPGDRLKLSRNDVAQIYSGAILNWNDPKLREGNKNLFLSTVDLEIKPVGRSDKCGTSFAFTKWLSQATSDAMQVSDQPSFGPSVSTYTHNKGVAQAIIQQIGSVGYLTYGFAVAQSEGVALLEGLPDTYVEPSVETIISATSALTSTPPKASDPWESVSLVNVPKPDAYPVSNILFIVVAADLSSASFSGAATVSFLRWMNTVPAQQIAQSHNFIPLTDVMLSSNVEGVDGIVLSSGMSSSLYWPPPPNTLKPAPTGVPQDPTTTFTPFGGFTSSPPRDYAAADVTVSDFSVIFTIAFTLLFIVLFVADNYYSGCSYPFAAF
jgi:phosphate transport system substrate-binding protein